mgnify:CR=1 FL=1
MEKQLKKIKILKKIVFVLLILSIIGLVYSGYNIVKWKRDSLKTDKQIDIIKDEVTVTEIPDNENTLIVEQPREIKKDDPYFDYIKMNLINVDFDKIKKKNNQVKGWIYVNGTNINYPFVQAKDNDFYLDHSFDKSYNAAGWVFLDYRNNIKEINKNTIIYAHSRLDNTMFGTLKNILSSKWVKNKNNYVIKLSTEKENTLWQVFSVYRIPTTSDYLQIKFDDNDEFLEFANMLLKRSNYNFNTVVNKNDYILTLSTCYNNNDKVVLHAKMIKKEARN